MRIIESILEEYVPLFEDLLVLLHLPGHLWVLPQLPNRGNVSASSDANAISVCTCCLGLLFTLPWRPVVSPGTE